MPYTPPKARSPVASQKSTPALTRNQSYDSPPTTSSSRPDLPRSRSAAYIQKHRRSPALGDANNAQQNSFANAKSSITFNDGSATVASAQVVSDLSGSRPSLADSFTQSPIDNGSSDEEERGRSRQIAYLAETLKSNGSLMGSRRSMSPRKTEDGDVPVAPHQTPAIRAVDARPALTPEARKISHSRSNSEMLPLSQNQLLTVDTIFSPGDSDDEDGLVMMRRRPLLRKKSGELVKPALRPSRSSSQMRPVSAPGTPSYPKAVHFNENMEQVRHFLQVDRPSAVSADSSPVEMYESETDFPFSGDSSRRQRPVVEWEIKTNFKVESHERMCQPVRVEQITLSKDMKSLEGVVAVANISFEKWVAARFTFDYWKTTSEVAAEWSDVRFKNRADGFDRFTFVIRLSEQAHLQNKTLFLCVRYNAGGQEHWDNNSGANYQVDFSRKLPQWNKPAPAGNNGIPRSRNTNKNTLTRARSFPNNNSDDEFTTQYESPFRTKSRVASDWNKQLQNTRDEQGPISPTHNRLASRYDFSTSLHGALMQAQTLLGDISGVDEKLNAKPAVSTPRAVVAPVPVSGAARPTLGSAEYKALIDKFCYFGSSGNSAIVSPEPEPQEPKGLGITQVDGQEDSSAESKQSSANSSASNSPPSPKAQLHQPHSTSESRSSTRNSSPSLRALSSPHLLPYRTPSPALSAYQEFAHQGLSIQTTKC